MREIGGYIELDSYNLPMLHEEAIALNCGRNALAYLIRAKKIKKILMPRFICNSVIDICDKESVNISFYSIDINFRISDFELSDEEWLYIVNYYGQFDNACIKKLHDKYQRIIIDNSQAYFQMPVKNVDTLYTCRKFFGVADGAFLYTDIKLEEDLEQDESFERMHFLLGRYERNASEFYNEYSVNNKLFSTEPIKKMSKLTNNLLHAIDYDFVKKQRTKNFTVFHEEFNGINKLQLTIPDGAYMYPLYIQNGTGIREKLLKKKIYVPILWPNIMKYFSNNEIEYDMAKNILPLPVDQRYCMDDMKYIAEEIKCII